LLITGKKYGLSIFHILDIFCSKIIQLFRVPFDKGLRIQIPIKDGGEIKK